MGYVALSSSSAKLNFSANQGAVSALS
jgi:hypothetical protein